MKKFTAPALLFFLLTTRLFAAQSWYVAPASSGGSDTNPGSLAQPFYTISQAGYVAQPGDTVYVRGGTYAYTAQQWIGNVGSAGGWITFEPYPGESPVLDFASMPTTVDAVVIGGQYIVFEGFEIKNSPRNGLAGWGAAHLKLLNNTLHGNQYSGLFVGYSDLGTVQDILVSGNTVYNNVIMNQPETLAAWPGAMMVDRCEGATISGNNSYQNYGEGIVLDLSDNGAVLGNQIHDDYSGGIYIDNTTHSLVAKNLVYTTYDTRFYVLGYPAVGIASANETYTTPNPINANQILNNVVIHGRFCFYYGNFLTGGGLKNYLVANNTFYNGDNTTLWIDDDAGHSNNLFENNVLYQDAGHGLVRAPAQIGAFNFNHNAWYNGSAGAAAGTGDVTLAPLFLNPGTNAASDYALQALSPLINAGVSIAQVTDDYLGTARPQGAGYDIGAFESIPPTATASRTPTASPTATGTSTFTRTVTPTLTPTCTQAATNTATLTCTSTFTATPANKPTPLSGGKPFLYPNPCRGPEGLVRLICASSATDKTKIKLFTPSGRKVRDYDFPPDADLLLDLNDLRGTALANGLYYVQVTTSQGSFILKLLILR